MNPYLLRLRSQFDGLRTSIEGLQTRAADENRDLTDELRSVTEQGEQATRLATQIESLTAIETRARAVEGLAATLGDTEQGETRLTGNAQTQDRDPGHYTRSSANSFFGDLYSSRANSDDDAQRRLVEHNRALSTGVAGAGIVPPKWLTDEMELLARQGRALASAVRNIDLGNDPRPITLPRQSTGTDAIIAQQASENTHPPRPTPGPRPSTRWSRSPSRASRSSRARCWRCPARPSTSSSTATWSLPTTARSRPPSVPP
jgi:HK97 family phage major capsid protein